MLFLLKITYFLKFAFTILPSRNKLRATLQAERKLSFTTKLSAHLRKGGCHEVTEGLSFLRLNSACLIKNYFYNPSVILRMPPSFAQGRLKYRQNLLSMVLETS